MATGTERAPEAPQLEEQEDVKPVRYVYSISSALLIGGAALSLATGHPAGAQVTNDAGAIQPIVPQAGAPASFADLTQQLQPAVVNISTRAQIQVRSDPFWDLFLGRQGGPRTQEAGSLGSGFIISGDGYVVTNNHVISLDGRNAADEITVKLFDGKEYPAEVVGRDAASDIAVLKIQNGAPLPHVRFGNSDAARAGDWVIAIGNPFGLGGTVTAGIISSPHRSTGSGPYDQFIQTDASINSGNSGGPMFDMTGQVIGINRWIIAPSGGNIGIGFAIPSSIAAPIVEKLIAGEEIERGYIGVGIIPIDDDTALALGIEKEHGELVQTVEPGDPAERAGIKPGDIVLKANGQDVTRERSLSSILANIAPGTRITLELLREGKAMTLPITVGKRPPEEELAERRFDRDGQNAPPQDIPQSADAIIEEVLGIRAQTLTPQIARDLGAPPDTKGAVILAVDRTSDAARKGLNRADIILAVNYQQIASIEDLEKVVREARADGRGALLLQVRSPGRQPVFVTVRLRDRSSQE
ncbi:MAG TPA: Do family serine endopeptidase [Sphingomonadaceae bacterium]|nr:Do family serine endopeptidase [Sphingomonadaceae bacterium]